MSDNLKVVATYNTKIEAEMAKGLLESEGLPAMVTSDDAGGMYPQFGQLSKGVRLRVPPEVWEEALEILGLEAEEA